MCDSKLVEHTDSWASGWWVSDRSAPGASTMQALIKAFFQKGAKTRTQLCRCACFHTSLRALSLHKRAAGSLPTNPVPTGPHPMPTGHRNARFCMSAMAANPRCQRRQEKAARRAPCLLPSRETSSRASKREQAPTADRCLPVGAGSLARVCFGEASSYRACQYPSAGNRSVPRRAFRPRVSLGALSRQVCGPGREHS